MYHYLQFRLVVLVIQREVTVRMFYRFTSWFLHHFLSLLLSGIHVNKGQMSMVKSASSVS